MWNLIKPNWRKQRLNLWLPGAGAGEPGKWVKVVRRDKLPVIR